MARIQWSSDYPGILIDDRWGASFKLKTIQALKEIASGPIGKQLLSLLSKRHQGIGTSAGKTIVITLGQGTLAGESSMDHTFQSSKGGGTEVRRAPKARSNTGLRAIFSSLLKLKRAPKAGSQIRLPGSGRSSEVQYNPNIEHQYTEAATVTTPPFVALAHELIHALHVISGDITKAYSWTNGTGGSTCGAILEEARTVGLGRYKTTKICENAIRREHGLPERTFYAVKGDCDKLRR